MRIQQVLFMAAKLASRTYSSLKAIPHSCAVLTVSQAYAADRAAAGTGILSLELMEAAGLAIAKLVQGFCARRPVVVLCGPGNNGGDGLVAARHLSAAGWQVLVALHGTADRVEGDAAANLKRWRAQGHAVVPMEPGVLDGQPLVVDALFGAGLNRPLDGKPREVIDLINTGSLNCIAADIPSGVCGDNGQILGEDDGAPACAATVTFFRPKPGHFLYPGRDLCGDLTVADIGIPDSVLESISPQMAINVPALWTLTKPGWRDHKYTRGHAVVVGGGSITGAARLAARAARRAGAGLLTLAIPTEGIPIYALGELGAFVQAVDNVEDLGVVLSDRRRNGVLIGPGCGVGPDTAVWVLQILNTDKAVVLDADALTSFEDDPSQLFAAISRRAAPVVMTPHSGEFDRLFSAGKDKLSRSVAAAALSGATVVFKGADTVIAAPDGRAAIATNAPPWLATGGAGDVLAGFVLGLLVQQMPPWEAAAAAVWLHGAAAEQVGRGLIAEDLPEILPKVLGSL